MSETRWGTPNSAKTAVLLHGFTSMAICWHSVAQQLVAEGYYVVAPDLLGHGGRPIVEYYTIDAFAGDLAPLLRSLPPISLLVGHSLGGLICARMLHRQDTASQLSDSCRVVLIDPPLVITDAVLPRLRAEAVAEVRNPATATDYMALNPAWSHADAAIKCVGAIMCDAITAERICDQNLPWDFRHLLTRPHLASRSTEVILLGSDPAKAACVTATQSTEVRVAQPRIKTAYVVGAGHSVHREAIDVLVKVLLTGSVQEDARLASYEMPAATAESAASCRSEADATSPRMGTVITSQM